MSSRHLVEETFLESSSKLSSRSTKIPSIGVPEDPRLQARPPEPPKTIVPKKVKEKTLSADKVFYICYMYEIIIFSFRI